ncbi:MAG TPA: DUF2089 family protein [Rhizomicrobium sp.]|nr:DUF2089 family protein [Rhizomicrobium sp.]
MARSEETQPWTDVLEPEELAFVRRFVLASGSLKEMAEEYGVSYPTIRQRLDELIEKVRLSTKEKPMSELRRVVRQMVEEGSLDLVDARKLLAAGTKDVKAVQSKPEGGSR